MTPSAIQQAIGERVQSAGIPVVWPNKKPATLPAKPYLVFQVRSRDDKDRALPGGAGYSEGSNVVIVVGDLNSFATATDDMAFQIKSLFPKALRLGGVTIGKSAVKDGYDDGISWRVPVQIDWIAT